MDNLDMTGCEKILALCIGHLISRIGEKITKKKWEDEDE